MWNAGAVMLRPLLHRLLAMLMVVALAFVPLAAPAVASPVEAASMTVLKDMMPCCSGERGPQKPDCDGKAACPALTICAAKCFQAGPSVLRIPAVLAVAIARLDPRNDDRWAGRSPLPPSRPPRC